MYLDYNTTRKDTLNTLEVHLESRHKQKDFSQS